jgi:hypothetical protein
VEKVGIAGLGDLSWAAGDIRFAFPILAKNGHTGDLILYRCPKRKKSRFSARMDTIY